MRKLMITVSLCLAATGAMASSEQAVAVKTSDVLTLQNGCTYTPVAQSAGKTWALQSVAAAPGLCPQRVRERAPKVSLVPDYVVGVYR